MHILKSILSILLLSAIIVYPTCVAGKTKSSTSKQTASRATTPKSKWDTRKPYNPPGSRQIYVVPTTPKPIRSQIIRPSNSQVNTTPRSHSTSFGPNSYVNTKPTTPRPWWATTKKYTSSTVSSVFPSYTGFPGYYSRQSSTKSSFSTPSIRSSSTRFPGYSQSTTPPWIKPHYSSTSTTPPFRPPSNPLPSYPPSPIPPWIKPHYSSTTTTPSFRPPSTPSPGYSPSPTPPWIKPHYSSTSTIPSFYPPSTPFPRYPPSTIPPWIKPHYSSTSTTPSFRPPSTPSPGYFPSPTPPWIKPLYSSTSTTPSFRPPSTPFLVYSPSPTPPWFKPHNSSTSTTPSFRPLSTPFPGYSPSPTPPWVNPHYPATTTKYHNMTSRYNPLGSTPHPIKPIIPVYPSSPVPPSRYSYPISPKPLYPFITNTISSYPSNIIPRYPNQYLPQYNTDKYNYRPSEVHVIHPDYFHQNYNTYNSNHRYGPVLDYLRTVSRFFDHKREKYPNVPLRPQMQSPILQPGQSRFIYLPREQNTTPVRWITRRPTQISKTTTPGPQKKIPHLAPGVADSAKTFLSIFIAFVNSVPGKILAYYTS